MRNMEKVARNTDHDAGRSSKEASAFLHAFALDTDRMSYRWSAQDTAFRMRSRSQTKLPALYIGVSL